MYLIYGLFTFNNKLHTDLLLTSSDTSPHIPHLRVSVTSNKIFLGLRPAPGPPGRGKGKDGRGRDERAGGEGREGKVRGVNIPTLKVLAPPLLRVSKKHCEIVSCYAHLLNKCIKDSYLIIFYTTYYSVKKN